MESGKASSSLPSTPMRHKFFNLEEEGLDEDTISNLQEIRETELEELTSGTREEAKRDMREEALQLRKSIN